MIIQLRSMMDNLSDIYYLVRLIVRQVSIYLRDLFLYKFFWITTTTNEEFDATDAKLRSLIFRNFATDIVAFSIICIVLFLFVLLASKCEKNDEQLYVATGIETVTVDLAEDPFLPVSGTNISTTNCFHGCGDSVRSRGRIPKRNYSEEDVSRTNRSVGGTRNPRKPKRSIFGLSVVQPRNSQSTQTTEKIFQKTGQRWLIRRTRSGQIYGKYPI